MIRKMLVIAAAAAIPVTAIAVTGGISGATLTPVDATNYTVQCNTISAKATFSPALSTAGALVSNEATTILGKAGGCTATPSLGGTPVSITGGTISGTINNIASAHQCTGLLAPTSSTGSLKIVWKTAFGTPKLTNATSIVNPTSVLGGAGANGHATFALSFVAATSGPFQGTDSGASSSTSAMTTLTAGAINEQCGDLGGLISLAIVTNTNPGAAPAVIAS